MLSRVAERVYWAGRYMERIENIARMINVNSNLLLDLPQGSRVSWFSLLSIVGGEELAKAEIAKKPELKAQEQIVMKLLISDKQSPCSILSCLLAARENARTTREVMPSEVWELINDLYLFAKENASKSLARIPRQKFLKQIIDRSQQCTGILAGAMSYTSAYDFIRLGRNLERADMTTRIVDVGAVNLMGVNHRGQFKEDGLLDPFASILWMSVLQSLSAYQMYRQHVLDRVNGEDVVGFLLQDPNFPRAVSSCLDSLKECLSNLPRHDDALHAVAAAQRRIDNAKIESILEKNELHEYIDIIQLDIASIHEEVVAAWFLPRVSTEMAA